MSGIKQWICKGCGQPSEVQCFVEVKGRQQARCPTCAEKHVKPVRIELDSETDAAVRELDDLTRLAGVANHADEISADFDRIMAGRKFKRRFLQMLYLIFGLALGVLGFLYALDCMGVLRWR